MEKHKIKICWICYSLGAHGGVIKRLVLWAKYFDTEKFEIRFIFSSTEPEVIISRFEKYDIKLVHMKELITKDFFYLPAIYALRKKIIKKHYDVIISMFTVTDVIMTLVYNFFKNPPILISYVAGPSVSIGKFANLKQLIYKIILKKLNNKFTAFITVSDFDKHKIALDYKIPLSKIHVNRIGIDFDQFHVSKKRNLAFNITFGFAGRFSQEKGIEYLIEAFYMLHKKYRNIRLLLAGDGPIFKKIKDKALKLELKDNIKFYGWINNISQFLNKIDILILPSLSEGTPRIILEAYYHEVPVIVTNVGGVSEIVKNGETGFLVEPKNILELKEKMEIFLRKPFLIKEFGLKAKAYVTSFHDIEREIRNLEKLLLEYIKK